MLIWNCNTSDNVELNPWQITYYKNHNGAIDRPLTEPVDFSQVKQIDFAISNWQNDIPGKGFVIISAIKGEKSQPQPKWWELPITIAAVPAVVAGIFSVIVGFISGFYYGRSKPKDQEEPPKKRIA